MYLTSLPSIPSQIALQTCIGLSHREDTDNDIDDINAGTYSIYSSVIDQVWLSELEGFVPEISDPYDYLETCFSSFAEGYILYDYEKQKALVPSIITYASVHNSIPIDINEVSSLNPPLTLNLLSDLSHEWRFMTPFTATEHMFTNYINQTTSLAKLNPGYDFDGFTHDLLPPLSSDLDIDVNLIDFIVKEKLFLMYLVRNCVPDTREHKLFSRIVTENTWMKPVKVYGYEDSIPLFGGDVFEAETNCVAQHNLGQIATKGVNNLSYFSRKTKQITEPLEQNPTEEVSFDSTTTYVALIVGDGDNINMLKKRNFIWWGARQARCRSDDSSYGRMCFPLTWTISPQLLTLIPDMIRYFFDGALNTGRDYFVLPPSGDLYSYPSMMPSEVQDNYIDNVVEDFRLLSTRSSVHWEWFFSWRDAITTYFPKYSAKTDSPTGFFLTNVPFDVPIMQFKLHEDFKIVGENEGVVLFKPNEWRGVSGTSEQSPSAKDMARRINLAPKGTLRHIYLTSDGGASIDSLYSMVDYLEDHVKIVSADALIDLAIQKGA
ncbi:hypothetical protein TrLO_g4052 [Triparma laevis f. longispina]|uniref:GxGYxYP putative glycoside hydrolase C-terminal domain-containing protein n=1 Tax=Triparma laevis f. longispina TaxID=1714387 RepID=A0A9W7AW90_9STRA|nr:hypothetical protein TrLO_g4052 [Triparma laevis f. longispina]